MIEKEWGCLEKSGLWSGLKAGPNRVHDAIPGNYGEIPLFQLPGHSLTPQSATAQAAAGANWGDGWYLVRGVFQLGLNRGDLDLGEIHQADMPNTTGTGNGQL